MKLNLKISFRRPRFPTLPVSPGGSGSGVKSDIYFTRILYLLIQFAAGDSVKGFPRVSVALLPCPEPQHRTFVIHCLRSVK